MRVLSCWSLFVLACSASGPAPGMPDAAPHNPAAHDAGQLDAPEPEPEPTTGTIDIRWQFFADNQPLFCEDVFVTVMRIVVTPPAGSPTVREVSCSLGTSLITTALGPHTVHIETMTVGGNLVGQSQGKTITVTPEVGELQFNLGVASTLGPLCEALAKPVCEACASISVENCKIESRWECCGSDGTCERPAIADPDRFDACLDAYASGAYCDGSPQVCTQPSGVIHIF